MPDRVGQQLGNYRLLRLLGRGGFAEVYLGEHLHLNTLAAIKVLHTQLAEADVNSFLVEARTIAKLEHPHIVRVFDFDVEDGTPFLVMSYAAGGSLRQLHPRGTLLPLLTIVSYVKQVADALQYAHDEKLIHRDIKPENMLVGRRNEVLLSDFGIATVAQSSRNQNAQNIAGTMPYMAPEQIQAHPLPASDQYALGIVVYEWLSGHQPFSGTSMEIAAKHVYALPPPLHTQLPVISPAVEEVVLMALAKDPRQRFMRVQAFAAALEQASQAVPVFPVTSQTLLPQPVPPQSAGPSSQVTLFPQAELSLPNSTQLSTPPGEPAREILLPLVNTTSAIAGITRKSGLSWGKAAFLITLTLLVVGGASLLYAYATGGNRNVNTQDSATAKAITTVDAKATATARANGEATATTQAGPNATVTAAANAYAAATAADGIMFGFDAQHTHFNPYEKVLNASNISRLVQAWTYPIKRNAFYIIPSSPVVANGIVYIGSEDHFLYALDAQSGAKLWRYQTGGSILTSPAVANGMVYFGSLDGTLYALDARSGIQQWHFTAGGGIRSSPAIANGAVYFGSLDSRLYALDALTGKQLWSYSTGGSIWSSPAVANGFVYFGSFDYSFYALNALSGAQMWSRPTGSYILSSPVVANGLVYIGSEDHFLYAFDVQSSAIRWSYRTGNDVDSSPAVADGMVFVGSRDNSLYAFDANSGKQLWNYPSGNSIFSPAAVANGIVYFGSDDHSFYALDVRSGRLLWSYRTGGGIVSAPSIANGMVYVGSDDNSLYAFHLPSENP